MGEPANFHDKFMFLAYIDEVTWAGFTTCSEIAAEVAKVQHFEGGRRHPHQSMGRVTYPDVTLTRGATTDTDLYNWFEQVYDAAAGVGLVPESIFRTVDIVQLNLAKEETERWRLFKAFPIRFSTGDHDMNADEKRITQVVLAYDHFKRQ
jgi:phage tail-like protein